MICDPDLGVNYLLVNDIEGFNSGINHSIYLSDDRPEKFMSAVSTRSGRTCGCTHAKPPEKRRKRKGRRIVNPQFLDHSTQEEEVWEAKQFRAAINTKICQKVEYCLDNYRGKYKDVLMLLLQGRSTLEIAKATGRTSRRIRQITNGNRQKGTPGLIQIVREMANNHHHPPPDVGRTRLIVAGVGVEHGRRP